MDEGERKPRGSHASRPRKSEKPAADPAISEAIGQQLKSLYDSVLTEPVPDALSDLVKKLAASAKNTR
jgi:hypothetical protein